MTGKDGMSDFVFYDLWERARGGDIDTLFPGWSPPECVAVLSPHDDDALLGTSYALLAARQHGARTAVLIVCDGSAGYSAPEQKDEIVAIRRVETAAAYKQLGVDEVARMDLPDLSAGSHQGWRLPSGRRGSLVETVPRLRGMGCTRLLIPNPHRENHDHTAAGEMGISDGPLVGDPVLADWGAAGPVRSTHIYSVWGDFGPEEALVAGQGDIRANRAISAPAEAEEHVRECIRCFASQGHIIEDLVASRDARACRGHFLELYLSIDPRPKLDMKPYVDLVAGIDEEVG